ncbi:hypothetical protein CRENBAI_005043 [Crenichthys baileyi]|uniref:Uncharacterized protein n=1 Tax=Crenichthys baileyi TaxID=28760 RepID=A0AAV9RGI0_9TELE
MRGPALTNGGSESKPKIGNTCDLRCVPQVTDIVFFPNIKVMERRPAPEQREELNKNAVLQHGGLFSCRSQRDTQQERHDAQMSSCWQADMTLQLGTKSDYDHVDHMQADFPHALEKKAVDHSIARLPACTSR